MHVVAFAHGAIIQRISFKLVFVSINLVRLVRLVKSYIDISFCSCVKIYHLLVVLLVILVNVSGLIIRAF